ncbi:dTDP-4-dehydrorhamnose reductase [Lutimonas saemankumensis]|uniref:dTDP-4-dehydrorhamnose reductase n=1 Tax=Lutimonas saemankumensis TaxID=483016 RepID=UPI001CD476C6|nr:dTDP-4-dehydrorhamnose reductase [Lutimonas saemankumensis]MCA0931586.1 dTDP-4-dehydrorhamnose reductase [Lutimonas saemankumensis]
MNILVTGSNGQLGSELRRMVSHYTDFSFSFVDIDELDITDPNDVDHFFDDNDFDYCINCAAFTAVDKSEKEEETALNVNTNGVINIAKACKRHSIVLIHISTDFVFDGKIHSPYLENDRPNPLNVYGDTKLKGEQGIKEILQEYFIIRTSWLYSSFGNNFVKTMLRLGSERESISVVDDQIGTPTYAKDLAEIIMIILNKGFDKYGIYHFSNEGIGSWYDFAQSVFEYSNTKIELNPISTEEYPLPAVRPKYSVLAKGNIKSALGIKIPNWRESLKKCILLLNERDKN